MRLRPEGARDEVAGIAIDPGDIALISFTSGTTGEPKAIPRSHAFLMAQYAAVAPLLASDAEERDLVAFPVFTLINLAEGRTSVLPNWKMTRLARLMPHILHDWAQQHRVTRMLIPPSLCAKLLHAAPPARLHTIFTGGGPVFPDIVAALRGHTGAAIIGVYGSTEAEPIAHLHADDVSDADMLAMRNGRDLLAGCPVPQIRLRIVDGEIQVAGAHVNDRYLDPAQTAGSKVVAGDTVWHRMGDAGALDDEGRLWLLGRAGGEVSTVRGPLHPFSLEVAARYWPGVDACALVEPGG